MLAFAAAFLPRTAMAAAHRWLGLGDFPDTAITFYLSRSTSVLYGVHGVLMSYVALTLKHHWRLVPVFGWMHVLIGLSMLAIDIGAPMPVYWTAAEGVPVAALGAGLVYLSKLADFAALETSTVSGKLS